MKYKLRVNDTENKEHLVAVKDSILFTATNLAGAINSDYSYGRFLSLKKSEWVVCHIFDEENNNIEIKLVTDENVLDVKLTEHFNKLLAELFSGNVKLLEIPDDEVPCPWCTNWSDKRNSKGIRNVK